MSEFITGTACADITGELYSRIMKKVEDNNTVTVIVPDQFVFETEKSLYHKCAETDQTHLFKNIRVRTIARISDEIIKTCTKDKPPADDITKNVIMYRAIHDRQVPLTSLKGISRKSGFASRMVKTVSLFKTAGIDPVKLMNTVGDDNTKTVPSLLPKLKDISALYTEYDQMLGEKYTDKLDVTMKAAKIAAKNTAPGKSYFSDESVFVTGFNSFSGSQLELMKVVAEKAMYSCFAFVCDDNDTRDIFKTVKADIAAISGDNADRVTLAYDPDRGNIAEGIRRVSELIYADKSITAEDAAQTQNFDMSSVQIIRADDIYGEMEYIAAEIRQLVNKEGLRYKDIAVLCSDPSEYRTPAESAFSKYDIPLFCDIPEVIINAPLTNLILSLLKALEEPSEQNILSYVRSYFLRVKDTEAASDEDDKAKKKKRSKFRRLSYREIDCFDGYIYRWKLNGKHFAEPFTSENMGKSEKKQAEIAEKVRLLAVKPLLELRSRLTNNDKATGASISEEICQFLYDEAGIENAVRFAEDNAATLWDILVKIFEAIHTALENVQVNIKQYSSLFHDICAQTTLAMPPQLSDCVLLGDTCRTRAEGIKVAFIAGASYGKFPDESADFGLFSEYEAELLSDIDLKIALKQEDKYHFSRYQAYRAMALPSERLYLTYPLLNTACNALSPSETVNELLTLFPSLSVAYAGDMERYDDRFYCSTTKALRSRYASLFGTGEEERICFLNKALELTEDKKYAEHLVQLVENRPKAYQHSISGNTAKKLFRTNTISATKLEKLSQCRFEYFCRNGLKIRERTTINASNTDVGNAVHHVLENVLREYSTKMSKFFELDRETLCALSQKYLDDYKEKSLGGSSYRSNSFNFMYNVLTSRCADILKLLQTEFACRKYRPVLFELDFTNENTVELPQPEQVSSAAPANNDPSADGAASAEATELVQQEDTNIQTPTSKKTLNIKPLELKISDDTTVKIIGVVDRADMFSTEAVTAGDNIQPAKNYLRIVDYKTGGHVFKMSNALYGVNTQMLIYLIALEEANKVNGVNTAFVPGGVSYLTAKSTEAGTTPNEGLLSLIASGHYPSGMCVVDSNTSEELQQFMRNYVKAIIEFDVGEYKKNNNIVDSSDVNTTSAEETANNTNNAAAGQPADAASNTNDAQSSNVPKINVECTVKESKLLPKKDAIPSPEQYQKLHDVIRDNAINVIGKLYSGDVNAIPIIYTEEGKEGPQSECMYCHYRGICGNQYRFGVVVDDGITVKLLNSMDNDEQKALLGSSKKPSAKSTKSAGSAKKTKKENAAGDSSDKGTDTTAKKPKKAAKAADSSGESADSAEKKPKRGRKAAAKTEEQAPKTDETAGGDNK